MGAGSRPVRPRGARRPGGCSEAGVGTRAASCCAPRWPVESRRGQEGARQAGRAGVSCRPVGGFSHPRRRPAGPPPRAHSGLPAEPSAPWAAPLRPLCASPQPPSGRAARSLLSPGPLPLGARAWREVMEAGWPRPQGPRPAGPRGQHPPVRKSKMAMSMMLRRRPLLLCG